MHINEYVTQKLRELENERAGSSLKMRLAEAAASDRRRRSKPFIGPLLRAAGRTLRLAGEGLEGWGSAEPDSERRLNAERRPG
ncbi:MAG: hypothetical protein E6J43_03905 [Chloroflexi bacterium]|nr:MAG: hypothetical protein E6J43_03905 [Chloroflexota bacterium]